MSVILATLISTAVCADSDLGPAANSVMKPLVRVRSETSTGSGTIVYCEDREKIGEHQTFILTNHHVVADAIKVAKTWDSLHGRWTFEEQNEQVTVELFIYLRDGKTVVSQPVKADIVAHDEAEDLALLKLDYPDKLESVAMLLPADKPLRLLQGILAVGCSLGVDPIVTSGHITDLDEQIDRKSFVMVTSPIIYGNSGGATFVWVDDKFYFAGIPSRVTVMRNGQAITTMGYIIPIDRIRAFITVQKLTFLLDPNVTPTESLKDRKDLRAKSSETSGPAEDRMGPPPPSEG